MIWLNRIRRRGTIDNNADALAGARETRAALPAAVEVLEARQFLSASPLTAAAPAVGGGTSALTVEPTVRTVSETFRAVAGTAQRGDTGILVGVTGVASDFRNLHASIDWGDGTDATDGTFARDARGRIHVLGTHTFDAPGTYSLTVNVSKGPIVPPGQPNPFFAIHLATIHSTAAVTAGAGVSLIEVATQKFTATLGSFAFRNIDLRLTATISWGDGKQSVGEVVRTGMTEYEVIGTHTYSLSRVYKVHVKVTASPFGGPIRPGGGPIAAFDSTIDVKGFA